MAFRALKGTYTRNSWDFYESGDALINAFGSFAPGPVYFAFVNNTSLGGNFDLYRADLFSDSPQKWFWYVAPPAVLSTIIPPPPLQGITPVMADQGKPDGIIVQVSGIGNNTWQQIGQRQEGVTMDTLQLANGGPFLTLPPNYALVIQSLLGGAGAQIAMRVWYQVVTDQVQPAG